MMKCFVTVLPVPLHQQNSYMAANQPLILDSVCVHTLWETGLIAAAQRLWLLLLKRD